MFHSTWNPLPSLPTPAHLLPLFLHIKPLSLSKTQCYGPNMLLSSSSLIPSASGTTRATSLCPPAVAGAFVLLGILTLNCALMAGTKYLSTTRAHRGNSAWCLAIPFSEPFPNEWVGKLVTSKRLRELHAGLYLPKRCLVSVIKLRKKILG